MTKETDDMSKHHKSILNGAILIFLASIFIMGFGYLTRIILAKKLTPEEFGLFFAIYNMVLLIGWIKSFGVSPTITKFIPEFLVKREHGNVKSILVFVFNFTIIMSIVSILIMYLIPADLINNYFQFSKAKSLFLLFMLFMLIDEISKVMSNFFLATQKNILYSLREFLTKGIVLLPILVIIDLNNFSTIISYVVAASIAFIINTIFFIIHSKDYFKHKITINKNLLKKISEFSAPMLIKDTFSVLMARMDNLIIVYFRPLSEVAMYNTIAPTADMLLFFSRPFAKILFPFSSKMWTKQKYQELRTIISQTHKYITLLYMLTAGVFVLVSKQLISILFGYEYASGFIGLNILVIGFIFSSANIINLSIIIGIGKPKQVTIATVFSSCTNLILNIILIPFFGKFNQGYVGATIATGISSMFLFFISTYYLKKYLNYNYPIKNLIQIFSISAISFVIAKSLSTNVSLIVLHYVFMIIFFIASYLIGIFVFNIISVKEIKTIIKLFKKQQYD